MTNLMGNLPGAIVSITSVSTEVLLALSNIWPVESSGPFSNLSLGLAPRLAWPARFVMAPFVDCGGFSDDHFPVRSSDKRLELGFSTKVEEMLCSLFPGFAALLEWFSTLLNGLWPFWDTNSGGGTLAKFWAGADFPGKVHRSAPSGLTWSCLEAASYCRPEAPVSL